MAGTKIETRVVTRRFKDLKLLEKNARYMTAAQFQRLVANIKRDGALTSLALVYQDEVLSGNHRVQAAIAAELEEGLVIEITTPLTEKQKVAIQLSHNAITGQDDQNILKELYDSLDIDLKGYSGLTDDVFKLKDLDVDSLSIGTLKYQELMIYFLPEEQELFLSLLKRIGDNKRGQTHLVAKYSDFGDIFNAVVKTKEKYNIHNSAIALRMMADLAMQKLAEMDVERQSTEQT